MLNIIRLAGLGIEQYGLIGKFGKNRKANLLTDSPIISILVIAVIVVMILLIYTMMKGAPTIHFPGE